MNSKKQVRSQLNSLQLMFQQNLSQMHQIGQQYHRLSKQQVSSLLSFERCAMKYKRETRQQMRNIFKKQTLENEDNDQSLLLQTEQKNKSINDSSNCIRSKANSFGRRQSIFWERIDKNLIKCDNTKLFEKLQAKEQISLQQQFNNNDHNKGLIFLDYVHTHFSSIISDEDDGNENQQNNISDDQQGKQDDQLNIFSFGPRTQKKRQSNKQSSQRAQKRCNRINDAPKKQFKLKQAKFLAQNSHSQPVLLPYRAMESEQN